MFMKNKKVLLAIVTIIIIILILASIYFLKKDKKIYYEEEESVDLDKLESEFEELFNNQENQYVETLYNIEEEKTGEYKININIPYVHIQNEIDNKINGQINDIFVNKVLQIINESESYNILTVDYATAINDNILSLAIRCILKEGGKAQRTIIKTYNYDIENLNEVTIMEIIQEEKTDEIQNKIIEEVEKQIKREETIIAQGYNIYRRDKNSDVYKIENATEFYIKDNILYIIYSYGNNNYTSEVDLVLNKI